MNKPYWFKPLEDFYSKELRSGYVKDMVYTVENDFLDRHVMKWRLEGKVELTDKPEVQIRATGIVE